MKAAFSDLIVSGLVGSSEGFPLGSPFRQSLRAICTVLLDLRDPLLQSERAQGFAADPDYWKGEVFAYVGSIQNLRTLL